MNKKIIGPLLGVVGAIIGIVYALYVNLMVNIPGMADFEALFTSIYGETFASVGVVDPISRMYVNIIISIIIAGIVIVGAFFSFKGKNMGNIIMLIVSIFGIFGTFIPILPVQVRPYIYMSIPMTITVNAVYMCSNMFWINFGLGIAGGAIGIKYKDEYNS